MGAEAEIMRIQDDVEKMNFNVLHDATTQANKTLKGQNWNVMILQARQGNLGIIFKKHWGAVDSVAKRSKVYSRVAGSIPGQNMPFFM